MCLKGGAGNDNTKGGRRVQRPDGCAYIRRRRERGGPTRAAGQRGGRTRTMGTQDNDNGLAMPWLHVTHGAVKVALDRVMEEREEHGGKEEKKQTIFNEWYL